MALEIKVLNQAFGELWTAYNGDSVEIIKNIPDDSIHYSLFSPPFASLFTYSDSERDMGNCKGNDSFMDHFRFLIKDLYRVLMPGRIITIHCMDILATITKDSFIGLYDFPGMLIKAFQDEGFIYHGRVTIWKDPLIQAVRTKALSLAHKQIIKDSSRCSAGLPDYLIHMRKPGDNPEKIAHPKGFESYIGNMPTPTALKHKDQRKNKFSHEIWQRYASPVWFDINQTNTLNIIAARDEKDEKHICPLQLETIARCLILYTNPDDIVLDPFGGIMSVGYEAVKRKRHFIGIELKKSYFDQGIKYLKQIGKELTFPAQLDLELIA